MSNINITIPDDIHKKLKIAAALEEKSLKDLVIEALQDYLERKGGANG